MTVAAVRPRRGPQFSARQTDCTSETFELNANHLKRMSIVIRGKVVTRHDTHRRYSVALRRYRSFAVASTCTQR